MEQYFIYNTFIFEKRNIQISIFILFYFLAVGNFMPVLTSELPKKNPTTTKHITQQSHFSHHVPVSLNPYQIPITY